MKPRKFAYVCCPHKGSRYYNARKTLAYCRKVYKLGYIPVCPWVMFPFLDSADAAEHTDAMEMAKSLIRRFGVFILTGPFTTRQMREENDLAKSLGKHRTTLDGVMLIEMYEGQPVMEDEDD